MDLPKCAEATILLFLFFSICVVDCISTAKFAEQLRVYRLHDKEAYFDFRFEMSIRSRNAMDLQTQLHFFPIALSEIASTYKTRYVHAALTNRAWVEPPLTSNTPNVDIPLYPNSMPVIKTGRQFFAPNVVRQASPGAEIYAAFDDETRNLSRKLSNTTAIVNRRWKLLTNALSSLLCASFNFVKDDNTVTPHSDADSMFLHNNNPNAFHKRYALLPRESVCTENLTPFLKLLPCQAKAGIAALFHSGTLAAVPYLTVSLDLWQQPASVANQNQHSVNVILSLATVVRSSTVADVFDTLQKGRLGSRDDLMHQLTRLIGAQSSASTIFQTCPLATTSLIQVYNGEGEAVQEFRSDVEPAAVAQLHGEQHLKPHHIAVSSYFSGYDQYSGAFNILLENRAASGTSAQLVLVSQLLPWFVLTFFHLLRIETTHQTTGVKSIITPIHRHIMPSIMRARPNYFEYELELPSDSVTKITVDVEYALMRWNEYPPDASRGLDIPACSVKLLYRLEDVLHDNHSTLLFGADAPTLSTTTIYSNSLLVLLPTPDFSMPYNVICLTCTVVALAVGPFQQMTTKRAYVEKAPKKKPKVKGKEKTSVESDEKEDVVDAVQNADVLNQAVVDQLSDNETESSSTAAASPAAET